MPLEMQSLHDVVTQACNEAMESGDLHRALFVEVEKESFDIRNWPEEIKLLEQVVLRPEPPMT